MSLLSVSFLFIVYIILAVCHCSMCLVETVSDLLDFQIMECKLWKPI